MGRNKNEVVDRFDKWFVHTRRGLVDAERTKSGIELTLASDGVYELASDRVLFSCRKSIEVSLGTRFNDIFGCSEREAARIGGTRQGQTIGPPVGPDNLLSHLALTNPRVRTVAEAYGVSERSSRSYAWRTRLIQPNLPKDWVVLINRNEHEKQIPNDNSHMREVLRRLAIHVG